MYIFRPTTVGAKLSFCMQTALLAVVFSFFFTPTALAHKVSIFAWVEGGTVYTESKFSGGKMVKGGLVEVFDDQGNRLLDGRTDDGGEFSFTVPKVTDLNIVLTAGMGHKNSWKLTAAELGEGRGDTKSEEPETTAESKSETKQSMEDATKTPALSAQAVEAIVARQLEQKLRPLTRMVAASQERGPTIGDIFGGIGYIIGLVGLGAYVRYRKTDRDR